MHRFKVSAFTPCLTRCFALIDGDTKVTERVKIALSKMLLLDKICSFRLATSAYVVKEAKDLIIWMLTKLS